MEKYLLKYLYDQSSNPKERRFIDYFKIDLDNRLYSYGMHNSWNAELEVAKQERIMLNNRKKGRKFFHPRRWYRNFKKWILSKSVMKNAKPINGDTYKYKVLSLIDVPATTIDEFNKAGIGVDICQEIALPQALKDAFRVASFNQLLRQDNYDILDDFYNETVEKMRNSYYNAVIVRSSEPMECKLYIDVFREIGRPSITMLHGLPGIYTLAAESREDYLMVWGEEIRKNFIKIGCDAERVIVAGNIKYAYINKNTTLRNTLDDVLVLTTATFYTNQHEWEWEKFPIQDRNLLITYLYSVEHILKNRGVQKARLRPHPSVNKDWLASYVDMSFYEMDYEKNLSLSLQRATLCIGQVSSTMLEAIMNGVSYLIYEPTDDGKHSMNNSIIVPPFDGTYPKIKVAKTEEELNELLNSHYNMDSSILDDWMIPFNAKKVLEVIEENRL